MRTAVRYSEAFKLEVVRSLEEGRYRSVWEAGRGYGIKGAMTVWRWVNQCGKNHLLGKVVWVMKADEQTELQALRQRVKKLEQALANAHLDLKLEEAYVRIACRAAGESDVEGFKKKHAGKL